MEDNTRHHSGFLGKGLFLRIISILCALMLWFYVSEVESPTSEKGIDAIAVTLRNKDIMTTETGLSVISGSVYEANVVLSGKKSTLNKINYEDITAVVDLSKVTEAGTHELPIYVTAPSGTTVVSVNPRFLTVSVDKTVAKSFDIETDIYYSTIYDIGDSVITDAQSKPISAVSVSGPATEVERVVEVVARVDFGSISSSVEAKTNLVCLDINGDELTDASLKLTPASVIVKQPVYMTKTLPLKAAQANNTFNDDQISFKVVPSAVEVKGDPKIIEELNEITLTPIDEKAIIGEALTNTVNALIKMPEDVELVSGQNTATITVNVKNVKKQNFIFTTSDITVKNAPESLNLNFYDVLWHIVVINASDKDLKKSDIEFELDLKDYTDAGSYTVNIAPKFTDELSYAYFPYESGYSIGFELIKKAGEPK